MTRRSRRTSMLLVPVLVVATAGQNAVTVNGKTATVSAATATRLTIVVPIGASSGPVRVTSPAGSATAPSDLYIPPSGFTAADVEQTRRLAYGAEPAQFDMLMARTTAGPRADTRR